MAIQNRQTGEITYEGRVYSCRGSFNCDSHVDIVEVINEDGSVRTMEFRDPSPMFATVDATDANIALMEETKARRSRVYKITALREIIGFSSEVNLGARQFLDLCAGLADNPNWKNSEKWRGLAAEVALSSLPTFDPFPVSRRVHRKLIDLKEGRLSKFETSLIKQCVDWATTEPGQRKYDKPLSPKQLQYLDKSWGYAA